MKIKIYTTSTCHFCQIAKEYFNEKGLEYEDIDAIHTEGARDELIKLTKGKLSVPVIVINTQVLIGFNRDQVDKIIKFNT